MQAKLTPGHRFFEIVEEAYQVFAVPKPVSTEVCDCCMDPEIEADFFNPPIRDIPLHYVLDWYYAACDPSGVTKETWAYLLPRILEILAAGEDVASVGLEVSLTRFETGNPNNWTVAQWSVLDSFQRQYLRYRVEAGDVRLDDVLCMFRLGGWPLEGLLDQVASTPDGTLARRFWLDWCDEHAAGRESVWITSFWEGPDNATVFDFYTSPDLYKRMEELALASDIEPELAEKALAVTRVIESQASWMA